MFFVNQYIKLMNLRNTLKSFTYTITMLVLLAACSNSTESSTESNNADSATVEDKPTAAKTSNEEVLNSKNEAKLFTQLHNNKITYIDFWASWCGPCLAEMPNSEKLKEEYSKQGINFIYLSVDESPDDWKQAAKDLGLPDTENYLLPKGPYSPIAEQFKINAIPRYMVMDKTGNIINDDAPRPSALEIRQLFDKLLKEK